MQTPLVLQHKKKILDHVLMFSCWFVCFFLLLFYSLPVSYLNSNNHFTNQMKNNMTPKECALVWGGIAHDLILSLWKIEGNVLIVFFSFLGISTIEFSANCLLHSRVCLLLFNHEHFSIKYSLLLGSCTCAYRNIRVWDITLNTSSMTKI